MNGQLPRDRSKARARTSTAIRPRRNARLSSVTSSPVRRAGPVPPASAPPTISSARDATRCAPLHQAACASAVQRSARPQPPPRCSRGRRGCGFRSPPASCSPWRRVRLFGWGSSVETYAAQLSADHLKCFQYPPEATSAADVTLLGKTWQTQQRLGAEGAELLDDGRAELLGIRRCGSIAGTCRAYPLQWRGEPLSVYVLNHRFDRTPTRRTITTSTGSASMRLSGPSTTGPTRSSPTIGCRTCNASRTYVRRSIE